MLTGDPSTSATTQLRCRGVGHSAADNGDRAMGEADTAAAVDPIAHSADFEADVPSERESPPIWRHRSAHGRAGFAGSPPRSSRACRSTRRRANAYRTAISAVGWSLAAILRIKTGGIVGGDRVDEA